MRSFALWLCVTLMFGVTVSLIVLPAYADLEASSCVDLIKDGSFETGTGWSINPSAHPAGYSTAQVRSGIRSMRLGIVEGDNVASYSSIQQVVHIPAEAETVQLNFWYYPIHEPDPGNDYQELIIFRSNGTVLLAPWQVLRNDQTWLSHSVDLTEFAGQSIIVYFNVRNDGAGGRTAMYLDDVSLVACGEEGPTPTPTQTPMITPIVVTATPTSTPTPTFTPIVVTATPTATPTPTHTPWIIVVTDTPIPTPTITPIVVTPTPSPTPSPTFTPIVVTPTPTNTPVPLPDDGCVQRVVNGGFERDEGWVLKRTEHYPRYVGSPRPVRSGNRAMQLGAPDPPDAYSYSSVRQTVSIPATAQTAQLRFWYWAQSDDAGRGDRQGLLMLQPGGSARLAPALWERRPPENSRAWREHVIDMTPYRGWEFDLYFFVINDGNGRRTALFLDDVSLLACWPVTPTPIVATATPTPGPIMVTATPTPLGNDVTPTVTPTSDPEAVNETDLDVALLPPEEEPPDQEPPEDNDFLLPATLFGAVDTRLAFGAFCTSVLVLLFALMAAFVLMRRAELGAGFEEEYVDEFEQ